MRKLLILIIISGCSAPPQPQSWEEHAKELFADPAIVVVESMNILLKKQMAMEQRYSEYYDNQVAKKAYLLACEGCREIGIVKINNIIANYKICKIDRREMRDQIKEFMAEWFIKYIEFAVPDDDNLPTSVIQNDLSEIAKCIKHIEEICN